MAPLVGGPTTLTVTTTGSGPTALPWRTTPVQEPFALAQFEDLREDEQLARPSFEPLEAGLTLDRSLQILIELGAEERVNRVLEDLQARVRGGSTFSAALEQQGGQFPRLYINMVRAGETSGALDGVLARLAEYLERTADLRETVVSALVYPLILLVVAGIGASAFQNLPQFVGERIRPQASRISISKGWSRLFGVQGLVEFLKSLGKLGFAIAVLIFLALANS